MRGEARFTPSERAPTAVVLGTNDIASAVAVHLFRAGYGIVLSRDHAQPVLRREMAFDDALVNGRATLEGVAARPADNLVEILRGFTDRAGVMVTGLEFGELLCLGLIDLLVDARMRMRALKVDIRPFARMSIGLGPGFTAGRHVDVAVETAPEAIGVLRDGTTRDAHGRSEPLAGIGRARFAHAPGSGLWETAASIGDHVARDAPIGTCAGLAVRAPLAGRLRGLVRSGVEVPADLKLLEVDPRTDGPPSWQGIGDRSRRIAQATLDAVALLGTPAAPGAAVSSH
ncbi:hypothetical protein [Aquabacter spiritensis]|uniref:Xanthine dehydrogenase accessory factor n=1 Tax=Aquabacter spiritensis TaxID=933073 RepID=A0A4R3LMS9_9HYPH|nr:hypothetical protein [Aquabacter spiritensis]TCT01700.1 hypothetical protein EDC64_11753 [Aquabacter spiritensis]